MLLFTGIKSKDGDYLIDPDKAKSVKLSYAGADIVYIYKGKNKRAEEILEITGPTTAKLNIMVSHIIQVNVVSLLMTIDVNTMIM